MNTSGEAAEQIFRITLEGIEFAVKITGATAARVAKAIAFLAKELSENKNSQGKIRLKNMLRSGKELHIFSVKDTDLEPFMKNADKFGISYCGIRDKKIKDGINDFFVYAEDAPKINRLVERLKLASVDPEQVKQEIQKEQAADAKEKTAPANDSQSLLDQILKSNGEDKQEAVIDEQNPTTAGMEKESPSAPLSKPISSISEDRDKPSVIGQLEAIKADMKKRDTQKPDSPQVNKKSRSQPKQQKQPVNQKKKQAKERA